jgi:hypothetical protein
MDSCVPPAQNTDTNTQTQTVEIMNDTFFITLFDFSRTIAVISVSQRYLIPASFCPIHFILRQLHETGGGGGGEDDDDDEDEGLDANHAGGGGGGADAEPSNYIVVANSEFKFKLWQYDASQIQVIYRLYTFGFQLVLPRPVVSFFLIISGAHVLS